MEDTPEDIRDAKHMKASCWGLREDLKRCLMESDCVRKDGKTPKECLLQGPHPSVPAECHELRYTFFVCKRSLLDMRQRFRGKKGY